ncbi:NAD(P)H-hydrate dehydratase [Rhodobacteraceae bacterium NNCM2]|nr:NAD(P)H-hydrate dehydratase [Coraliihabitans acroporae]
MTQLLTAAQMRAIEQAAIDSGEVTGLELMERAGRGVVEAVMAWRPALATTSHRAVILCGPGNNGGDGFVIARLLTQRGWAVEVLLFGDITRLPPDAAENARRWREVGAVTPYSAEAVRDTCEAKQTDLIVDALFGTGLTRPIDALGDFVEVNNRHPAPTVAVDIPSGICADSGRVITAEDTDADRGAVRADLTVSFHAAKLGHHLANGSVFAGALRIADIGLGHGAPDAVSLIGAPSGLAKTGGHKYGHGHALILSGGVGKGGAARLAARGVLRIGAGLVTVGCPPAALIENAARLDAIMLRSLAGPEALAEALADTRLNALCLGPGFGVGERTRDMVAAVLAAKRATVLDADALTSFAEEPETLFRHLHDGCILTPHDGEFARLFPDIAAKLRPPAVNGPAYSKVDAAHEAATRAGCTILFKGPDTVIAAPGGGCAIHSARYDRAAPWLATAGSGDVLAGFITGLLARGLAPIEAAKAAAWLHVECARNFGPGLIAEDLPERLPAVFREFGL